MTPIEAIALAAAALAGSAAQSATGFGFALALAPAALALLDPPDAVLLVSITGATHCAVNLAHRHRRLELRTRDARVAVAAALPGLVAGALIVAELSKPVLQLVVGTVLLAALAVRMDRPGGSSALGAPAAGWAAGAVAGVLTTTIGVNGPPLVIWLRAHGATVGELRDTLPAIFLTLNLAAIPALLAGGARPPAAGVAAALAGLGLGHALGELTARRLATGEHQRAVTILLVLTASATVIAGVLGLGN